MTTVDITSTSYRSKHYITRHEHFPYIVDTVYQMDWNLLATIKGYWQITGIFFPTLQQSALGDYLVAYAIHPSIHPSINIKYQERNLIEK